MSEDEANELTEDDSELDDDQAKDAAARDPLAVAMVAGIAALLLICVVLIFVANGHRPAGL